MHVQHVAFWLFVGAGALEQHITFSGTFVRGIQGVLAWLTTAPNQSKNGNP